MSVVGQQPTQDIVLQQPSSFQPYHPAQSGMFNNVVVEPVVQTQPTKNIQIPNRQYSNQWSNGLCDCTDDR